MDEVTSYARSRFLTAIAFAAAGAVLGAGAFVFSTSTERWLALGIGAGVLMVVLGAFALAGRGALQRVLDVSLILVATWTLASSRSLAGIGHGLDGGLVRWLGASSGFAIALIGLLSLFVHEFGLEGDLRYATERIWGLTAPHPGVDGLDTYPQTIER